LIHPFLPPADQWAAAVNVINNLASIASILSFLGTLFLFFKTRGVAAHYITKSRLPDYLRKIRHARNNLEKQYEKKNGAEIRTQLRIGEVTLRDLVKHLRADRAEYVSEVIDKFDAWLRIDVDDDLWKICGYAITDLQGFTRQPKTSETKYKRSNTMSDQDRWSAALTKLIQQTELDHIRWQTNLIPIHRDDVVGDIYICPVYGKYIAVYEYSYKKYTDDRGEESGEGIGWERATDVAIEFVLPPDGRLEWRWPARPMQRQLLDAIGYQASGARNFLDNFLKQP